MKISKLQKINIYKKLSEIRIVEEKIADSYSQQEMRCPIHLSIGQEASAVGVCGSLKKNDIVYSSHRSHAHYIAKDCNIEKMIMELHGKAKGCVNGRGGSMHLQDINNNFFASIPIVSSAMGLAAGIALNLKRMKSKSICVVFIGDGSCEEGIFHEVLNFIAIKQLPLLVVCENNFYSVYTNIKERQINYKFTRFAKSHNIKSSTIDGNDVIKIFNDMENITKYMRKYSKPYFLQLNTYRWREHCGPNYDNHIGYRSEKEFIKWRKKCPVKRMEIYLKKNKILSYDNIKKINDKLKKKIDLIFQKSINSNFPDPRNFNKFIYK